MDIMFPTWKYIIKYLYFTTFILTVIKYQHKNSTLEPEMTLNSSLTESITITGWKILRCERSTGHGNELSTLTFSAHNWVTYIKKLVVSVDRWH